MSRIINRIRGLVVSLERLSEICKIVWIVGGAAIITFVCPPIGVVLIAFIGSRHVKPKTHTASTHGTARFATLNDMLRGGCLFQHVGTFLGSAVSYTPFSWWFRVRALLSFPVKQSAMALEIASSGSKKPRPLLVRVPDQFPHTAVFGATGSGKSTCFGMQTLSRCGDSMVCLDPKGEQARIFARLRERKFGQQVILIDPFNIAKCGYKPQRLNPLDCFRPDEVRVVDNARRLANALIVTTGKESERFWTDSSITVVTAILAFLMTEAEEGANLNHLRDITSNPATVEKILQMMLRSDKACGMLRRLAGEVSGHEGKTKASVFGVTNSNLSFLDSIAIANSLCESTFDPNVLVNSSATIFLCLPIDRLTEMASLQRIILSTLINLVFAAGENPNRRVHFLLDEAATLGPMDALYSSVQFGRSYGIRTTFLFQSSTQVERCFPESQRPDFMSTVAKVFAGSDDLDTAKTVSDMMGTSTVLSATEQTGVNDGRTGSTGIHDQTTSVSWGANNSTSYAEHSRSLMTPAEVLTLPRHLAIALLPGMSPVLIKKMPYYQRIGRGLFGRMFSLLTNIVIVSATFVVAAAIIWGLTLGRHEPIVLRVMHAASSFWRQ
ncbi:type IV secretory system conjugative DNA transfer family protein [Fuerstiella marisgermanici]|uniref:Conjugal transfer protein TraG n=1 Tax=Fuerstiella marisgermanici TaxID=1891926 RepID=A0A1P8WKF3_9PLAN|nr:type IV secretory system conjugative DNA transfer family protein [Fuerstiella marisgermanici]APZ94549.1 Conjugal transfer protein TraG [Fuerstiella marisgermanici]